MSSTRSEDPTPPTRAHRKRLHHAPSTSWSRFPKTLIFWVGLTVGPLAAGMALFFFSSPWAALFPLVAALGLLRLLILNDGRGFGKGQRRTTTDRHFNQVEWLSLFVLLLVNIGTTVYCLVR